MVLPPACPWRMTGNYGWSNNIFRCLTISFWHLCNSYATCKLPQVNLAGGKLHGNLKGLRLDKPAALRIA